MNLWETENCQFYRHKFQERVEKYDRIFMNGLLEASGGNRLKFLEKAQEAMPEPPAGCNVCHYLYDMNRPLRQQGGGIFARARGLIRPCRPRCSLPLRWRNYGSRVVCVSTWRFNSVTNSGGSCKRAASMAR